jgi:hypothetical protein
MTWITPTAFWEDILVMFCWEGGATVSSKSSSDGGSPFGGNDEVSPRWLKNVLVHAVRLAWEAGTAILAATGVDEDVPSGALEIGLNG